MAVNKNFVVKNGLEVNTDLIFADASTEKVGIGSTIPATQLDVKGGIAVTDINATGVTTVVTLRGTTGIVTTIDAISIQATNLTVSGVSTGLSINSATNFYVSGVTTTTTLDVIGTGNMAVGIITNAQGTNLNYAGISTLGVTTTTDLTAQKLNVSGISTLATNVIFTKDASGIGATVGAAVGVVTYYGDGVNLTNVSGQGVGVRTTGAIVGYGFTILNFIGAGNTFAVDGKTVDISIAGGGGGGSVSIGSEAPDSPSSGSLWYHTEYGRTFVYFDEVTLGIGNTAVWVDAAPFNQGGQFINKYGDNALGAIGYTGGTTSQASIYYTGDPNTGIYFPAADHVGIVAGGTKSLEVNPSGISVVGVITGDGSGLTGVASTDNIITTTEAKLLGGVRMEGFTTSATMNVTGISTFRNDITLTGSQAGVTSVFWDASANTLQFQDLSYAKFGAGGDLSIYHDASHSYISEQGTGNLKVLTSLFSLKNPADNSVMIQATKGDSVDLYYSGSKKIETTSTGAVVTSVLTATSFIGTAATIGTGVTINNTGIDAGIAAGIITAKEYHGDGSNLSGIAAGGSGQFNTSISGATQYDVTASMATAYTASATATIRTVVHSIHICNISASEVTVSGEMQTNFSFAHTIPVPAGSAVELLKQPKVLGPSETIELQASSTSSLEATIIVEEKEDTALWDAQIALSSAATLTDLYTSSSYPSVVQSILLCNNDGSNDVKARVVWTDGSNNVQSYLVYDMVIPADSTVEICEQPKYLATGYKLRAYANQADRLEITASGSQIVS